MIFVWINSFAQWIQSWFVPPIIYKRIDPGMQCPWCGNYGGKIDGLSIADTRPGKIGESVRVVQFTCKTCNGPHYLQTVKEEFESTAKG